MATYLESPDGGVSSSRSRRGRQRQRAALVGEEEAQELDGALRSAGWRFWRSAILRRVLIINVIAAAIPILGLLHLTQYRESLIEAELKALETQGSVFALALGATSVLADQGGRERLVPELTRHQLRLLLTQTGLRARLYGPWDEGGRMLVDSYQLPGPNGVIVARPLEPEAAPGLVDRLFTLIDSFLEMSIGSELPAYNDGAQRDYRDFSEIAEALQGEANGLARRNAEGQLVLTMAVPVQRYRQVLGALLLSKPGESITEAVDSRRIDVLVVFGIAISITVLVSLYLGSTIAKPIRHLARAAHGVKTGKGKKVKLPDYSRRRDEIGDLGRALTAMTDAMWARLDAIENFAADVAHEIKNPLTSLKSAVETVVRVQDRERQRQLMAIILDDVARLDRLITDISDASRIDAELARAESAPVDLRELLTGLIELHRLASEEDDQGPRFLLDVASSRDRFKVQGLEGRLGQVFRNIIMNAATFSPPGGSITVRLSRSASRAQITVDDEGPGIPDGKAEALFDRFYTERPESEKFGTHSGLGLSISKQIVEAHKGRIWAENRYRPDGTIAGARFLISLPLIS